MQEHQASNPPTSRSSRSSSRRRTDLLRTHIAKYRDAASEFDQARARLRREVAKESERSRRSFLADLLEVLDNLDRAIDAASGGQQEGLLQGVDLVRQQFLTKLKGVDVTRVDPSGQPFDPASHEAISSVPVSDPAQDNIVVGVVRPGYQIGHEVLRPALVAVGKHHGREE